MWVPAWFAGVLFGPRGGAVPDHRVRVPDRRHRVLDDRVRRRGRVHRRRAATRDGAQVQQVGELVMALLTAIAVLVSALLVFVSLCVQAVIAVPGVGGVRGRLGVDRHPPAPGHRVADPAVVHRGGVLQGAVVLPARRRDGHRRRGDRDDRRRGRQEPGADRDGLRGDAAGRVRPADPAQARPGDPRHQHLPGHRRHPGRRRRGRTVRGPRRPRRGPRRPAHRARGEPAERPGRPAAGRAAGP